MTLNDGMMSSNKNDWETPHPLFNNLDKKLNFTLDAAANHLNAKCHNYFTEDDDAFSHEWRGRVWLNPPYGVNVTGKWVEKARAESKKDYCQMVCVLIPARTDTKYFHEHIMRAAEIWFIVGRLKFVGAKSSAPFPSMLVFFDGNDYAAPVIRSCNKDGLPLLLLNEHAEQIRKTAWP